jgi:hypothetical protein
MDYEFSKTKVTSKCELNKVNHECISQICPFADVCGNKLTKFDH